MSDKYKYPDAPEMPFASGMACGMLLTQIAEYMGKYQITFQFWGAGSNHVFIEKYGTDIYSSGGFNSPSDAIKDALDYLDRINNKKRSTNPNF